MIDRQDHRIIIEHINRAYYKFDMYPGGNLFFINKITKERRYIED